MMATYYHGGAEIQAGDNLQTLYLMNPNYLTAYSEINHTQTSPNMLLLNPSANPNAFSQGSMSHAPPHQQQLIGIPLVGSGNDPGRSLQHHQHHQDHHGGGNQIPSALHGMAVSRAHYNLYSPTNEPSPTQPGPIHGASIGGSDLLGQMGFGRPNPAAQGLSLSLSPGQQQHTSGGGVGGGGEDMRMSVTVARGPTNGGVILGSKYLKAAQELLEEVVSVGGDDGDRQTEAHKDKAKALAATGQGSSSCGVDGGGESSSVGEKGHVVELTTAQRQDLQMKKAKLLSMLEEVEQRYRQYSTQMQAVVSSFEQAAGIGSAKLYTCLALKTISKQFRCLKDAIASQIKATSKSIGEEDNATGVKLEGGAGSRLRFVDQQLRQQRALQQLGMMQHNAWRPQRGLPERAVSVLRAWLFEHFLHPYPKDSDKHLLAKQTGLTRGQVSNWFINARVRLWKPMVEEMYLEEVKSQEQNGVNSEDNTDNSTTPNTGGNNKIASSSKTEHGNEQPTTNNTNKTIPPQQHEKQQHDHGLSNSMIQTHQQQQEGDNNHTTNDMISSLSTMSKTSFDMESLMARSPKKQRSNSDMNSPSSILSMDMEIKLLEQDNHHKYGQDHQNMFNPYMLNDLGRFSSDHLAHHQQSHGNGVSLTLGLPRDCENNLSFSGNQHQHQNFMHPNQGMQIGRRVDIGPNGDHQGDFCGISMGQSSHPSNNGYESIDIQSRKRFSAQILHDFVA